MKVVIVFLVTAFSFTHLCHAADCERYRRNQESIFEKYPLELHDEGLCNYEIMQEYICDNYLPPLVTIKNLHEFSCWYGTSKQISIDQNGDIHFDDNYRGNFYDIIPKARKIHFFMLDDQDYEIEVYLDQEDDSSLIFSIPGGNVKLFASSKGGKIFASKKTKLSWDHDKDRMEEWWIFKPE